MLNKKTHTHQNETETKYGDKGTVAKQNHTTQHGCEISKLQNFVYLMKIDNFLYEYKDIFVNKKKRNNENAERIKCIILNIGFFQ